MKERLQQIWESLKEFWGNLSRKARILLFAGAGAVLVLVVLIIALANHQEYVLLYNDLSPNEYAQAVGVLSEMGIEAQTPPNGSILVPERDVNRARMQLATQGFPGSNFEYLYSPGLTATQQDKRILENQDLQNRLQATIETFDEVSQAVVTISAPEKSAFALQAEVVEPSASVTLVLRTGRTLSSQQVRGIINIVRDSVAGLKEENISITDSTGDLKASAALGGDASNAKLSLTEEVNQAARSRILTVVQPMFGPGRVEVAVNSVLDTNAKVTERTTYDPLDPDNPERNPVDYTEHDRTKDGDATGVAQGVPGANDNVGTPQYGEEDGELAASAYYTAHDVYDYLVGSTKEQITKEGLDIVDMTVTVVVDAKSLAEGQRDQIVAMASKAAGVLPEQITVQNFEFAKDEVTSSNPISRFTTSQLLILAAVILLVLIVIITTIIIILSKRKQKKAEDADKAQLDENGVPLIDLMNQEDEFEPIAIVETQEQKLKTQIKDLADSDPEIVAQLLKNWITSG